MHNNDELQKLKQELTAKNSFQISLTLNLKRMQITADSSQKHTWTFCYKERLSELPMTSTKFM